MHVRCHLEWPTLTIVHVATTISLTETPQVGGLGGDTMTPLYYVLAQTTGHYITYSPPSIVSNVTPVCKAATNACSYTISIGSLLMLLSNV